MQFPGLFHLLAIPHLYLPPHPFSLLCQLYDLLDGIQKGTVKFQVSRESDEEGSGSFVFTEENKEEYQNGEMEENE